MLFSLFIFRQFAVSCAKAEAAEAGTVINLRPSAWVERDGRRHELSIGAGVRDFDVVRTGDGGYVTINFIDNTEIQLWPESEMSILDIAFTPKSSRFSVYVSRGAALIATGGIGLKNSFGVGVTTPKGIVTAFDAVVWVAVGRGEEVVRIEDMTRGPRVSVYNSSTANLLETTSSRYSIITDAANNMREIELAPGPALR
jgi:hypothetical protein